MESRNCPNCGAPSKSEKCEYCGTLIPVSAVPAGNVGNAGVPRQAHRQAEQVEELSLWGYYVKCLKNFANFKGRARRKEFWGFVLFEWIVVFAVTLSGMILFGEEDGEFLGNLYWLATLIPQWAVTARRLHDVGRSGWSQLWALTVIGAVFVFIWLCSNGLGDNEYGPDPKGSSPFKDYNSLT